jgi:Ca2+-binding EF-hand superfamily protein
MYDLDHNNFIDVKEMTKVLQVQLKHIRMRHDYCSSRVFFLLKSIYKLLNVQETQSNSAHERAHAIFKQLDLNKDKLLSREEFVTGCENDDFLRCLLAPNL